MIHTLRILPAADADLDAAADYIARDNLDAALRFLDSVHATFRELRRHPKRWPKYDFEDPSLDGIRKRTVLGFKNYLIFYRLNENIVEIIRILHGARDIPATLSD